MTPARKLAPIAALAAILAAAPAARAQGQDPSVSAQVDATRIGEGDSVTLTIEIRGTDIGGVEEPDLSGLADFTIASGPSVSTSTSMVWSGGKATSTSSKQYGYVLLPRRRGSLTIPLISVAVGGKRFKTDPLSIEVVEGSGIAKPLRRGSRFESGRRDQGADIAAGEVLAVSSADKKEVYVGEQLLLTYKIYYQLDLAAVPVPQRLPSYTGFWVEEIPVDQRASINRTSLDGKEYLEITLMKKALFPTTSGNLTITESVFEVPVKMRSRDPFDSLFFTPTRTIYRKTAPLTIRVKPLPEAGRPDSFNGAVGTYDMKVTTDRPSVSLNDALGLSIVVEGTGNIGTVGEPLLPALPDYKRYAPKVGSEKKMSHGRLSGRKSWDYVLTPLAPGQQDIPPIRMSYFDPIAGAYRELSSERIAVQVGAAGDAVAGGTAIRRGVAAFDRDIRYIKPVSDLKAPSRPFHTSPAFTALLALPVLLNAGLFVFVKRRERLESSAGFVRGRRAPAFARRRLKKAATLLSPERSREFHQEIGRALTGYVGDKLDIPPAGLTHERIESLLAGRLVDGPLRADLLECLHACDYARFAPVAPGLAEMKELLDRAGRLIVSLESRIGTRRAS